MSGITAGSLNSQGTPVYILLESSGPIFETGPGTHYIHLLQHGALAPYTARAQNHVGYDLRVLNIRGHRRLRKRE